MKLLATQAMPQMRAHAAPGLGRLVTPRHYPSMHEHGPELVWAADNDCFQGLDRGAWLAMLDAISPCAHRGRLVFATVPDVVADARATADAFDRHAGEIIARGLPVGLVAQDGILAPELDAWRARIWPELSAVFLGGSDEFKLGAEGAAVAQLATSSGLWLHMGRVNSEKRIRYAAGIGCDSFDGTGWVRFRTANLDRGIRAAEQAGRELRLDLAA